MAIIDWYSYTKIWEINFRSEIHAYPLLLLRSQYHINNTITQWNLANQGQPRVYHMYYPSTIDLGNKLSLSYISTEHLLRSQLKTIWNYCKTILLITLWVLANLSQLRVYHKNWYWLNCILAPLFWGFNQFWITQGILYRWSIKMIYKCSTIDVDFLKLP